jgi:hypothetical protein
VGLKVIATHINGLSVSLLESRLSCCCEKLEWLCFIIGADVVCHANLRIVAMNSVTIKILVFGHGSTISCIKIDYCIYRFHVIKGATAANKNSHAGYTVIDYIP